MSYVQALYYPAMINATTDAVSAAAAALVDVLADADRLLCTSRAFRARDALGKARALTADASEQRFLDRVARAQVTTWLPACSDAEDDASGVCSMHFQGQKPPLEDYANKAWGGMVQHYYGNRIRCYSKHYANETGYYACIDDLAFDFQADFDYAQFPLCNAPLPEDTAASVSLDLLAKYEDQI
jgi:hypothetical protein